MPIKGVLSFASAEDEVFAVLSALDTLYEANEPCVNPVTGEDVPNHLYDLMRQAARHLFPRNPYWDNPTGSAATPGPTFRLRHPMVSIEKAVGPTREHEYVAWVARCRKAIGPGVRFSKSYKIDGTGAALQYENGTLARGGLRPHNGYDAEDRTKNMLAVAGIPERLPLPLTCTIRGEIYVTKPDFAEVNRWLVSQGKKPFANERSYSTGSLRHDDPGVTASRRLRFLAHSIVGLDWHRLYATDAARAVWCSKTLGVPHVRVTPHEPLALDELYAMEKGVPDNDKLIDGIIVMVDDLDAQEQMGTHGNTDTGAPRAKLAWKLPDEEKVGTVSEIVRQTGRTGAVTPVAVLREPLSLEGTKVTRVTLHNLAFVHAHRITAGTSGKIAKAGKIIPKWVETVANPGDYASDAKCPACHQPTPVVPLKDKGLGHARGVRYSEVCTNRQCPAQVTNTLLHYLHVFGVKGLGDATVEALVEADLVKTPADFYRLTVPAVMSTGLSERQAVLALAGVFMIPAPSKETNQVLLPKLAAATRRKVPIPLWQLFAAFGVDGAGKTTGKLLAERFHDFDRIRAAGVDELLAIPNVGEATANSLLAFFANNKALIDDVLNYVEPTLPVVGPLTGYTFCLSSIPDKDRYESEIERRGGKVVSGVSKDMAPAPGQAPKAFLVSGDPGVAKFAKARELGVAVIDLPALQEMFD